MCISVLLQSGSVEKISNPQVKQVALARVLLYSFRKKKTKKKQLWKKKKKTIDKREKKVCKSSRQAKFVFMILENEHVFD